MNEAESADALAITHRAEARTATTALIAFGGALLFAILLWPLRVDGRVMLVMAATGGTGLVALGTGIAEVLAPARPASRAVFLGLAAVLIAARLTMPPEALLGSPASLLILACTLIGVCAFALRAVHAVRWVRRRRRALEDLSRSSIAERTLPVETLPVALRWSMVGVGDHRLGADTVALVMPKSGIVVRLDGRPVRGAAFVSPA